MGSFTSLGARQALFALFPATTTSNLAGAITAASALRIYTTSSAPGSIGIFAHSGSDSTGVRHRIDLLQAGGNGGTNVTTGLADSNFTANGLTNNHPQTATAVNFANYTNYEGMSMVTSAQGNHAWLGWTVSTTVESGGAWKVTNNGAIAFPSCGATGNTVCGFVLSAAGTPAGGAADADGTSTAPQSTTQLLSSYSGSAGTVLFAYGDLSSFRAIANGDTPIFTSGAISITLT